MVQEPIIFLANLVLIAHADGKLSAPELVQMEALRVDLKLKKSDLTAAIRLVEQGKHKITPIGSFADQVKNLELLISLAYADDDLNESETLLINDFSNAAGIYPDQLEKIQQEVFTSLQAQGKLCPSCGTSSDMEARFCPKCGLSLFASSETINNEMVIPSSGLAIEFAESTAASFPKALEIAKAMIGFQSCLRSKKTWYLAAFPSGHIAEAIPLCEALSGFRNRRLYLDGQEKPWDEVFGFVWCSARRATAYRPIEYCFRTDDNRINPWGCRLANMEWSEWARWFCYGHWEKTGIFGGKFQWRFNKDQIHHELATNLFRYRFCPHLKTDLSEAILRHFPETVMPESDRNWDYHRAYEQVPGAIKITGKKGTGSISFIEEYWSSGVCPKGMHVFTTILTKALRDIGSSPISVDNLLK